MSSGTSAALLEFLKWLFGKTVPKGLVDQEAHFRRREHTD
jgi:hypothetical protein